MTALSASFPTYYASEVSYHAAVPAPVLPEGMRELSMYEFDYVNGAGFWNGVWKAFTAVTTLFIEAACGPIGGAIWGGIVGSYDLEAGLRPRQT